MDNTSENQSPTEQLISARSSQMEVNVGEGLGYPGKGCRLCNSRSSPKFGGCREGMQKEMAFSAAVEAIGIPCGGECRLGIR